MSLCPPRSCGCAFQTSTLDISVASDGSVQIDLSDAYNAAWPLFSFLDAAEREASIPSPQEAMEAWLRSVDEKWRHDGTAWRLVKKTGTYTPTQTGWGLGTGATITGAFSRVEDQVTVRIEIALGTGPTFAGTLNPSLPYAPAGTPDGRQAAFRVTLSDVGLATYLADGFVQADGTVLVTAENAAGTYASRAGLSSTVPFTWVAGDLISIYGTYMCDPTDSTL